MQPDTPEQTVTADSLDQTGTADAQRAHATTAPAEHGPLRDGTRGLEVTDSVIYLLVGGCFLLAAALSLVYSVLNFVIAVGNALHRGATTPASLNAMPSAIITFVSDLLLTLIILEVMGTVVSYLKTRATSLKPFLFIGIISAVRGILAVGARLSVSNIQLITIEEFRNSMIE
ncbi:MAG TPA: phosphate-starvation-inducible PsiE family protein, partial [Ktedonobacterales bacterium]|nr:phosphate-starvation-inducible PsiE family protein [Ktedonobacterales bacterium]